MSKSLLRAMDGDIVRVRYTLSLRDGPAFGSQTDPLPFEFMIGRGAVLPAFENAVIGMLEGETREITVPPEKAYGPYDDGLVHVVERSLLPPGANPKVGSMMQVCTAEGSEIEGEVIEVDDWTITVDENHEFAGKELVFEISLLKIIRPG
jgi:FKBP-type peptidyl-prolyl cis-trans isomerase 2